MRLFKNSEKQKAALEIEINLIKQNIKIPLNVDKKKKKKTKYIHSTIKKNRKFRTKMI